MGLARHFFPPEAARRWIISRDWGTNQIARKALFTCVVYTKYGYRYLAPVLCKDHETCELVMVFWNTQYLSIGITYLRQIRDITECLLDTFLPTFLLLSPSGGLSPPRAKTPVFLSLQHFNRSLRLYAWKELKLTVSNHGICDHNYSVSWRCFICDFARNSE